MSEKLFVLLINLFPSSFKNRIKYIIQNLKKQFPKLFVFFYGSFEISELLKEIEINLKDDIFDVLMIHTSYNNLKPMYNGNVSELLNGLLELSQRKKVTLVMPGFTLGNKNQGAKNYYESGKCFEINKTPTTVGLINELFRRRKGVVRSLHPTHSILAIGPKAKEIIKKHHLCDTTFGQGTPFDYMNSCRTKIIGLGVYYFRNLTHVHVAEDLMKNEFPFPYRREFHEISVSLVDNDKNEYLYKLKCYTDGLSKRRNLTVLKQYMHENHLKQWRFKGVPMFVAEADKVTEILVDLAKNGKSIYN